MLLRVPPILPKCLLKQSILHNMLNRPTLCKSCIAYRLISTSNPLQSSLDTDDFSAHKPPPMPKFSETKAGQTKVTKEFGLVEDEDYPYPPSTRWVVKGTFIVLLVYFIFLREENDFDEILERKSLFETKPELERPMLEATIEAFKLAARPTLELEKRLCELIEEEARAKSKK